MVVLLGGTGYIGRAFRRELERRKTPFVAPSRSEADYTRYDVLGEILDRHEPEFLINAAGYTGKPNVDACEAARADTLQGNTLFPLTVSHACRARGLPWGHVSSGCIYSGAHVEWGGEAAVERDLMDPAVQARLRDAGASVRLGGFREEDEPNFSFRRPPCSFYSGSKALAEEALAGDGTAYIWRLRIPFDEHDGPRNYLSKVQRYPRVYDNYNSISHRGDFVKACLDSHEKRIPAGVYNVTNPGYVTTRRVVGRIQEILQPGRTFEFWESDEAFYKEAAGTPRSNCILEAGKLLGAGVAMRPVEEALEEALRQWRPEKG